MIRAMTGKFSHSSAAFGVSARRSIASLSSLNVQIQRGKWIEETIKDKVMILSSIQPCDDKNARIDYGSDGRQCQVTEVVPGRDEMAQCPAKDFGSFSTVRDAYEPVRDAIHERITYSFPSSVALIDVVSQWSQAKVEKMRYAEVSAYPVPLYRLNDFTSYFTWEFTDVLPIVKGLQLETLRVFSIWDISKSYLPKYVLLAIERELKCLLKSKGWRNLEYISKPLPLAKETLDDIKAYGDEIQKSSGEGKFKWHLDYPDLTSAHDPETTLNHYSDAPAKVIMSISRGAEVKPDEYVETGEGLPKDIQKLLKVMNWKDMRQIGLYLVDDGMVDPEGHL